MEVWEAIVLGLVRGLTEFLPVSSSGHLALFKILFDVNTDTGILYDVLLHVGTLIAISLVYYRDILKLVVDGCCIIRDAGYNVIVFFRNKTGKEQMAYRRVINSSYRKFAMLIIVSTIPTGIIGYFCKDVVEMASEILIVPGICFIATAVLLLILHEMPDLLHHLVKAAVQRFLSESHRESQRFRDFHAPVRRLPPACLLVISAILP